MAADEATDSDVIRVSFQLTERDWLEAFRYNRGYSRTTTDALIAVLLLALGIYLWNTLTTSPARGVIFAAPIYVFFRFILPRIQFRLHKPFRNNNEFLFAHDSIQFRTAGIDSRLQWSLYTRAIVTPTVCLLYHEETDFTIIPQRVFKNEEERQRFDKLLSEKIPSITRRPR